MNTTRCIAAWAVALALLLPGPALAQAAKPGQATAQVKKDTAKAGFDSDYYFDFSDTQAQHLGSLGKLASAYLDKGQTTDGLFLIILSKTIESHLAATDHFIDLALFKKKSKDKVLDKHLAGSADRIIALLDKDVKQLQASVAKLDDPGLVQLRTEYQKYLETAKALGARMKKDVKALGLGQ